MIKNISFYTILFLLSHPTFLYIHTAHEPQYDLPFYRESSHLNVFCQAHDQTVADEVIEENALFIADLQTCFNYTFETNISFCMFPSIDYFHQSFYKKPMPPWLAACYSNNTIWVVSPNNPGTVHKKENIKKSIRNGLAYIMMENKYGDLTASRWLRGGTAFFLTHYYNFDTLKELTLFSPYLPTIKDFEISGEIQRDPDKYGAINGFRGSYSLVRFLNDSFGWETILQLLENYNDFESIIGMNKQELRDQWIISLSKDLE